MPSPDEFARELDRLNRENHDLRKHNRILMERQHHNDTVGDCRNPPPMQADTPHMAREMTTGEAMRRMAKEAHQHADDLAALAEIADALEPGSRRWHALNRLMRVAHFEIGG